MLNPNELVVFVHIMKTGGTTLRVNFLVQQYESDVVGLNSPEEIIEKAMNESTKYISGHFGFGLYKAGSINKMFIKSDFPRPLHYITLLREPVDRIISLYYDIQRRFPDHPAVRNKDLKEFVETKNAFYEPNLQTLFITGGILDFKLATERITNDFKVVGITELFNESVFLMKKELGWDKITSLHQISERSMTYFHTTKLNNNPKRQKRDQISRDLIEFIERSNSLDIQLYQFAKEYLIQRINSLDLKTKEEMDSFLGNS
ncbi:sulfotransferase family 2 domain-containing protein [Paenibacillus prosopidis]|uniref:Sulfotransferase family protein n=1 Tax=Paenibacillus prosopidis TaxID=630520 RepID=A0A368W5V3_9BACL|nr:sulfotransferase family 2 domain-containing protein [Paenibacillus prosopidis]RCW50874.1 sulfotransferase family protein [Paenibacillus prosopidis]